MRFAICRLPAAGIDPAGTYAPFVPATPESGTYLHLRAALPERGQNVVVDPDALAPATEWDPEGIEIFPPGCSQVFAIGGIGLYSIYAVEVPTLQERTPRLRRLMRYLPARGASFVVPVGHNTIGALNGQDAAGVSTLLNVTDGNVPLRLTDGVPQPIPSGTNISTVVGGPPVMCWTGFFA